ncbi:prephenate dehydrogenase [uncultured Dubosiella sp.]|uniref:prephenate dehydrogenase n=1 Tax=uncultured Dubosiella sp. TaxID=1937011 RepID=UPI002587816A|nr:prephenate dehydrogenase [uncultured Dubosiella sp.]
MKTIGIVGLGVMGASFAQRAKALGYRVLGIDLDPDTIEYAVMRGMVDKGSTDASILLDQCDIVLLALYPRQMQKWLLRYQHDMNPGTLILEISGVKSNVTQPAQALLRDDLELLSIHPMCGRESRGIEFADPAIFDQANFIIIPQPSNSTNAIVFTSAFAKELGCKNVSVLSVEEHDRMIGFLSQLTHVIAVALMNTHENSHLVEYTGDSFRDLTRIAKINEDMWTELFLLNKDILLDEIDQFAASVQQFRDLLVREDVDAMKSTMVQSTARRKKFDR